MFDNNIFIFIIVFLSLILIIKIITNRNKNSNEKFTLSANEQNSLNNYIESVIKDVFKEDVDAARNLDKLLNSIYTDTAITFPVDRVYTYNIILQSKLNLNKLYLSNGIDDLIKSIIFPIGCIYIQFPDNNTNDLTTMFPDNKSPAQLFGGTWIQIFNTEGIFFRTPGKLADELRTNGFQDYAMKHLTGQTNYLQGDDDNPSGGMDTSINNVFTAHQASIRTESDHDMQWGIALDFKTTGNDKELRVTNRLFRIWKRIPDKITVPDN
jgi:hypothetical protein